MRTRVAPLCGIPVAGGARVATQDLRDLAPSLGFARPETPLATGNPIFAAAATSGSTGRMASPAPDSPPR